VTKWQAFIFDFDGVLADSVEVKTRAFANLYEPYGQDVVDQVVAHHRKNGGMNRYDKFRHYHEAFLGLSLSSSDVDDLAQKFSRVVIDEVVASPEIPGAGHFLEANRGNFPYFLNSATPEDELREIVTRRSMGSYFTEILGAPRSKADNLGSILTKYHLQPNCCLFFGDAESDYHAAMIHGVQFMGLIPDDDAPLLVAVPDVRWKRNFYEVEAWLKGH